MKCTLATTAVLLIVFSAAPAEVQSAEADFFVATDGSDDNPGTKEKPFATLAKAQEAVRRLVAAGLKADVTVLIRGGTYQLDRPLAFGPEDSATETAAITYAACPAEKVIVSGGRKIAGWQPAEGKIWTAGVPKVKEGEWYPRQLYVNGRRAVRARTSGKDEDTVYYELSAAELSKDLRRYTISFAPGVLAEWRNIADVEVMAAGNWAINRKRLESVDVKAGVAVLAPPHAVGHSAIRPGKGRWCYFENARELLDRPGEWYLDRRTGVLSYWPLPGEDMTGAETVVPVLRRLLEVTGRPGQAVRNLHFKGISFEHTNWPLPDLGYLGIQACHHTIGKEWKRPWGRIPAAVRWEYAEQCSLEDGTLAHLGGCGIELVTGCRGNLVRGNHVFDVSGNGVMLSGPKTEAEVPKDDRISNNHVHACGVDYYGAVAIWVGFAQRAVISHNLVHDLPYSGISVGWQWNPQPTPCKENLVECNHVYDVMNRLCDGGCIYTLGLQPGTVIRGNHLHDVHRGRFSQGAPNNGMFIDQGSKGYLFERNVIYNTSAALVRFNQCSRDWHTWRDNHFGEPLEVKQTGKQIIAAAGLQPPYRERLSQESP